MWLVPQNSTGKVHGKAVQIIDPLFFKFEGVQWRHLYLPNAFESTGQAQQREWKIVLIIIIDDE